MSAAGDPELAGVFKRPFAEQLAFWRAKLGNQVPTSRWDDLWKSQHDRAFMVAGAAKADLLSDLAAAVDRAIAEGVGIGQFRKDFDAVVAKHGWAYTGERNWRTRVIYRTNAATSYAAGRLAQLRAGGFKLWMYKHGGSLDPRPQHLAWDGLVLPPDHPFWQTHAPPNGWGCSCRIVGVRSKDVARRLGGDPDKILPDGWDAIDPRTGEPRGIDRGWGYQPGASVDEIVQQMAAKTLHWEYVVAKAYMQDAPAALRDALATAYRELPSVADDTRRYAAAVLDQADTILPRYRTLGLLTTRQRAELGELGEDLVGFDFALDRSAVEHIRRKHGEEGRERSRGQRAIVAGDYARLPQLIEKPNSVEVIEPSASGHPQVRYTRRFSDGEQMVAVFEVRRQRRSLALQSMWVRSGGAPPA